jgi:predicted  nucleic acid-binding Zn-ribbon protein
MDDLKEALAATAEAAATHAKNAAERAARIEALEQRVSELEEALSDVRRRLEYGLRTTQIAGLDMQVSSSLGVIDAAINREPNP